MRGLPMTADPECPVQLCVGGGCTCAEDQEAEMAADALAADLDPGIADAVMLLRHGGVETYESCQGGPGHSYPEPTVAFHGGPAVGPHALSVAMTYGLPVSELRRVWRMESGEPTGPSWQLVFSTPRPAAPLPWWWMLPGAEGPTSNMPEPDYGWRSRIAFERGER